MNNPLKTIIIADDEEAIRRFLVSSLERAGYQCLGVASNGAEAIDLIRRLKPQVALIDLHMPISDGLEVTRQTVPLRCTALVILTGDTDPEIGRQALDLGACGYMQKPFGATQVAATIESAWHRFQTVVALEDKAKSLDEALELRKLTEKAKGILMEQQGLSEEEAHRTLLKLSQDQGLTLKEVCRSVIQVRMVLGKKSKRVA